MAAWIRHQHNLVNSHLLYSLHGSLQWSHISSGACPAHRHSGALPIWQDFERSGAELSSRPHLGAQELLHPLLHIFEHLRSCPALSCILGILREKSSRSSDTCSRLPLHFQQNCKHLTDCNFNCSHLPLSPVLPQTL